MSRNDDHDQALKAALTLISTELVATQVADEAAHNSEVAVKAQASTEKRRMLTVATSRPREVASQQDQPVAEVRHKQHRSLCDLPDGSEIITLIYETVSFREMSSSPFSYRADVHYHEFL